LIGRAIDVLKPVCTKEITLALDHIGGAARGAHRVEIRQS